MTKKILCLILSIALIISTFVITTSAAGSANSFSYHEDFADQPAAEWTTVTKNHQLAPNVTVGLTDDSDRGSVLSLTPQDGDSTSFGGVGFKNVVTTFPQKYVLSFFLKDTSAWDSGITIWIGDPELGSGYNRNGTFIPIGAKSFPQNKWFEYRITIDKTANPVHKVERRNVTDGGSWTTCASGWDFAAADGGYRYLNSNWADIGLDVGFGFIGFNWKGGTGNSFHDGINFYLDDVRFGWGTSVSDVTFDPTTIPASGTVTASFALSNLDGLASADAIIAGYDKNGQMIAGSSVTKTLTEGSSTITASLTSSTELADGGWIEAFLWNSTTNEIINGGYGALGTPAAVGTTTETDKMVRSTSANTFTVEGKTSASAPITVIAKQGANLLAASHFAAKADGTYSRTFGISPDLCTNGTATITVYGADTTAQSFDIPVYSNWDAMVTAFKAMDTAVEAESFFTTYENNFKYYAAGSDTLATDLTAISDYAGIALLNSKRAYADEMTPAEVIESALDLVASLPEIATFEQAFADAKAEATEAEQIAAIKDLITNTTLITFDFDGVFNKDAVAKALISSAATSLADIYNDFITARDAQKGIEQSTAAAFRAVADAADLEAFFVDNQATLGIDPTPFAGYWEVMYGVYDINDCDDPSKDVNEQITFLIKYIDDYKVFIENITRAAKTNKNWEAIKAVLTGNNGNVTVTLTPGTGTVVEETEIYKRLIDMDCTSLATVEAAYTAAWTAQAELESEVYNVFFAGFADKEAAKDFLQTYNEILDVPATTSYTDTQHELFAELYNALYPFVSDYSSTKAQVQMLVSEVTAAETFIANINTVAAADNWSAIRGIYEGAAYAGYFGAPSVTVTDERELYTRIIDIAKETPFAVLADVKAAFDTAHADQLSWEAQSGAYENPDDALLDFVSTEWTLDIQANIVTLSGKVEEIGNHRVVIVVEDTPGHQILIKQIATAADGSFSTVFGLNPDLYSNPTTPGNATMRVAGSGLNVYKFADFPLYTEAELNTIVSDFVSIANKTDLKNYFDTYSDDLKVAVDTSDDRVLEALLFAYNKNKTAGAYSSLEDCLDVLNGKTEGTGAVDIIATMEEMIDCLDALTAAANEVFGDGVGNFARIKSQVEKSINNGWITPNVNGIVSVTAEPEMYLAMAGQTYNYMTQVESAYEIAYASYARKITDVTLSNKTVTFDGKEHELVPTGLFDGAEIKSTTYTLKSEGYFAEGELPKYAGDYEVEIIVGGNGCEDLILKAMLYIKEQKVTMTVKDVTVGICADGYNWQTPEVTSNSALFNEWVESGAIIIDFSSPDADAKMEANGGNYVPGTYELRAQVASWDIERCFDVTVVSGKFIIINDHVAIYKEATATCTEPGNIAHYYCSNCDECFEDEYCTNRITGTIGTNALGHSMTKHDAKDATCTEDGNVAYYNCSTCVKNFEDEGGIREIKDIVLPAEHKLVKVDAVNKTCTTAGNIEYYKCTGTCGKNYKDDKATEIAEDVVIPASHVLEYIPAKANTSTEDGNIKYYKCNGGCKKLYTTEDATEETTPEKVVLPAFCHKPESSLVLTVDGVRSRAGKTIEVPIYIENNMGIAGLQLNLSYDKNSTLTGVSRGDALLNLDFTAPGDIGANPVVLIWDGIDADDSTGTILTLVFNISEYAEKGFYPILLEAVENGIYGDDLENVECAIINSGITVLDYIPGDINDDSVVGTKDVTVLRRHIAGGYDVTVVNEALDVNGDGTITTKDVTTLRRFIAGGYGIELK